MLLMRMSSGPKITVGLIMACDNPESVTALSTSPLPLKYGSGEPESAFVMLTCTILCTPASWDAFISVSVFSTALSKVIAPCEKRTQYVL